VKNRSAAGLLACLVLLATVSCTVQNVNIRPPETAGGSTEIFGEIKNNTDGYARDLQVKGQLLDATGTVLASPYFWTCTLDIKPQDTVAFGTYYTGTESIASYDLKVEGTTTAPLPDVNLSISDVRTDRDQNGRLHVLGTITNTGSERYERILVCVAFYDSSGRVDGYINEYAPDVDPGQRAAFDVFGAPFGGEPSSASVSYRLWVQPRGGTAFMGRGYVSTEKLPLP